MSKHELKDIVIVIPGIMGSVLTKQGVDLWAASWGAAYRGLRGGDLGEQLKVRGDEHERSGAGDGVQATRLLSVPSILPRLIKADGYGALREMIASRFRVRHGDDNSPGNFYEFPYDWRLDNRIAAKRLREFVARVLPAWRTLTGDGESRVIIVGHSMGGLVGRYYTEVLEGWRECRALITLGTPHRGSLNAVDCLANDFSFHRLRWISSVVRTFPSVHQLLPIYEALDTEQGRRRVGESTGIFGIDDDMAVDALRFHREIEESVAKNRRDEAYLKSYRTIPFVGTDQPTPQSASYLSSRMTVINDLPYWIDPLLQGGDGTVPRVSAIPIENDDTSSVHYVAEKHGLLQSNRHVLSSLRSMMTQMTSRGLSAIRGPGSSDGPPTAAISLEVDDVQVATRPVEVRAVIRGWRPGLVGTITGVEPPSAAVRRAFAVADSEGAWRVDGLDPGLYRVEVEPARGGQGAPSAVRDFFAVIPQ